MPGIPSAKSAVQTDHGPAYPAPWGTGPLSIPALPRQEWPLRGTTWTAAVGNLLPQNSGEAAGSVEVGEDPKSGGHGDDSGVGCCPRGGCFYQLGFSCSHCCVHQSERASRDGCDARKMHLRREQRHCYRNSEGGKFDSDGRTRIVCDRVLRSCRPDIHRGDSWPSTGSAAALDSQRLYTGDNKVVHIEVNVGPPPYPA